jgi:branched-chain amino acid transport system substrate-binding protein
MRRRNVLLTVIAALATGGVLAACGGQSSNNGNTSGSSSAAVKSTNAPIVIGAEYENTGPVPVLGHEGPGAQAAAKYINAHGGINGRQVKVVLVDNAGDPSHAVSALRQFQSQGINIVLGGAFGLDCDAEAAVAASLHQVVFCGSTDNLPKNDSNMFGIGPGYTPTIQGTVALIHKYAPSKAAIFADLSADGADSIRAGAADFKAVGLTPIVERYPVNATTFTPEIQAAMSKGAQALWFTACSPGAITSVGEAESLGFKGKIMLENCLAGSGVAQALKGLAHGTQVLVQSPYSLLSTPAPNQAEANAITVYKSQIPGPVDTVESAGWDSMMVAAKAIEAAHSTSTSSLLSTLSNNFSYTGVWHSGTFTPTDHRGAILAGYAVPTYFTSKGTIALLPGA